MLEVGMIRAHPWIWHCPSELHFLESQGYSEQLKLEPRKALNPVSRSWSIKEKKGGSLPAASLPAYQRLMSSHGGLWAGGQLVTGFLCSCPGSLELERHL
ncbi:unnamed protein product [Rangifer tarandus platyrhynchus]|uniref:Uncharacterized protein n=2 Tax=Rangifer tarandus platyrhynchus TaxID=3082113 RepID=A0AC59ZRY7_RANTA|nr:unnamed protein product [Rangifer tarandus platyrhynchus]